MKKAFGKGFSSCCSLCLSSCVSCSISLFFVCIKRKAIRALTRLAAFTTSRSNPKLLRLTKHECIVQSRLNAFAQLPPCQTTMDLNSCGADRGPDIGNQNANAFFACCIRTASDRPRHLGCLCFVAACQQINTESRNRLVWLVCCDQPRSYMPRGAAGRKTPIYFCFGIWF